MSGYIRIFPYRISGLQAWNVIVQKRDPCIEYIAQEMYVFPQPVAPGSIRLWCSKMKSQLASRVIWVISCFLPVEETELTVESSCLSCPEDIITLMRLIHSMKYVKYDVEFQYYFEYTQKYRFHQIKNLPLLLKTEGDHFILSWNIAGSGLINCVFRSYPRYCSDCQAYN